MMVITLGKPWLLYVALLYTSQPAIVHGSLQTSHLSHPDFAHNPPLLFHQPTNANTTVDTDPALAEALKLVQQATEEQGAYNSHRVANPKRNSEISKESADAYHSRTRSTSNEPQAPVLTPALRRAAAIVAQHQAKQQANMTASRTYPHPQYLKRRTEALHTRDTSSYWLEAIKHTGLAPMGANNSYPVFRDVTDPMFSGGAKGDGVTDDTEAINAAIAYGGNCGEGCLSSSIKGTLIYFPPGKYLISTPINAMYYSQLVGNALQLPTIITSKDFVGLGAIQSDVYIPNQNGDEWYIQQSNFYRQVRNLNVDITGTTTEKAAAFHWQVAQATSMTNVNIYASTDQNTTQMGLFTENGSGGFMSNVFIFGGKYGIYGGNQQYTVRDFELSAQTDSCIALIWDWGWTWSRLYLSNAPNGFSLLNPEPDGAQETPTGSIYVMDSIFAKLTTGIKTSILKEDIMESTIIQLDNLLRSDVESMIEATDGNVVALPEGEEIGHIVVGNVKIGGQALGRYSVDVDLPSKNLLAAAQGNYARGYYFAKDRPQYENMALDNVISVKDHGAKGDGVADDTAAIKSVLAMASASKLIYFPAGSYIITSTIIIPSKALITGEVWSQLVASGSFFEDMNDPKPMVKVGNPGDSGTVEISDMLFTSVGPLAGLTLVEWNIAAESQGSVGLFDSHFRIGGAYGSKLTLSECPKVTTISDGCIAASMLLHITPESNGYFENVWAWVADHDLDDPEDTMVTVAVARGILVESSDGPTWLYGTSSEHSMLYQYNFANTSNMFAGMIQTESPYFQHADDTQSPGPFKPSLGVFNNDPDFFEDCDGTELQCNFSWALMVRSVSNVTIAGAGLYSWFDAYDQSVCVDAQNCQQRLINDQGENGEFWLFNLVTIGAVEMISDAQGAVVKAKDNTQADTHPFWSALALWGDDSDPVVLVCDDEDPGPGCDNNNPCDLTREFSDLDALIAAEGSYAPECGPYYATSALGNTLASDLSSYDDANNGYDDVFHYYEHAFRSSAADIISKFVMPSRANNETGGPGNKYFDCTITMLGKSSTKQCPFSWQELVFYQTYDMKYTLRDKEGFYNALNATFGISKDWVKFENHDFTTHQCIGHPPGGMAGPDPARRSVPEGTETHRLEKRCGRTGEMRYGFPEAKDDFTVPNPKDTVVKAMPKMKDLQIQIAAREIQLALGNFNGSVSDISQAISLPVFMMSQSIEKMEEAKKMAKEIKKEMDQQFLLEMLGVLFLFLPFLDEFAPELLLLDGMATGLSFLGNTALAIKDIVDHPENAVMDVLGIVTDGAFSKTAKGYRDVANARRGIDGEIIGNVGKKVKDLDGKLQGVLKKSCAV